ncbi:hypothetical protein ABPG72_011973 [Tetrahymena utriculariae]
MSSMLIWGACFGLFTRAAACKASMIPLTSSPWKYPKYMIVSAVAFYYFEWYRRMALEQLCYNEEKLERYQIRAKLQSLKIGEELSDAKRESFFEHAVQKNNI